MYISPINSRQNISSKARLSLLADKNLLPKDATKQIAEKVKTIGRPDDTIHLCVYRRLNSQNIGETTIIAGFLGLVSSNFTDYTKTIIRGGFTECQKKTLNTINNYLDYLKKEIQ